MRVGFHVSIRGSIDKAADRAVELGCKTFQMFTRNPRRWKSRVFTSEEVKAFIVKINDFDLKPVIGHIPYLPNLASPKDGIYARSVELLISELRRCKRLEIPYLVTHLGSHLGAGKRVGFKRVVKAIDKAFETIDESPMLILENTAGTRNSLGSSFEDIQHIIGQLRHPESVGVCFDTCHAFAAGYDLRTSKSLERAVRRIDDTFGLEKIKLIHLNDSIGSLNSHIDRHEHIGKGNIGKAGIKNVLRQWGHLPLILETPKKTKRDDMENIQRIKELADELKEQC